MYLRRAKPSVTHSFFFFLHASRRHNVQAYFSLLLGRMVDHIIVFCALGMVNRFVVTMWWWSERKYACLNDWNCVPSVVVHSNSVCLHAALHNPVAHAAFHGPQLATRLIWLLLCLPLFPFSKFSSVTKYQSNKSVTPTLQDEAFRSADSDYWGDLTHVNKPVILPSSVSFSLTLPLSLKSISDGRPPPPPPPHWWIYY